MGSCDDRNTKAIDSSVGGLVWVRRRNGSWWPGRIMAHHEVPHTSVVSPKSGTPIKLLGRDDASVDWYNLEKSKRVKAFRCGDYDDCIEKAKASASANTKKAIKYARREDAIVHALEIENSHLSKDNPELCTEKAAEDLAETGDGLEFSKSLKKYNNGKASKVEHLLEKRRRTPNDSEDDGIEGNKRMRVLEDIGMGIGSKGKPQNDANHENGFKSDVNNGSSRDSSPSTKRKRSPAMIANEYPKRKNRRRPLTKVLEDATFSLKASENAGEAEAIHSEISTKSALAKDDLSTELFDVPLIGGEKYPAGISSPMKILVSGQTIRSGQSSHDDVAKEKGCNGSACTTPQATLLNGIDNSASKWQLKGKRNSRQMSKKQEERRNAFTEEANNNSLPHCSVSGQGMGRNPQLYDVKIEVKANYKPRSVPLISLRSKMNGEAIVGHPITVEVLEDGSCDRIMSNRIKSLGDPILDDANAFPQKPLSKKKSKKRKKSSSLSKKTRCLSALSGQKVAVTSKKNVTTEKARKHVVACIPLKVVFSRINEAVKGSVRQVHRALPP